MLHIEKLENQLWLAFAGCILCVSFVGAQAQTGTYTTYVSGKAIVVDEYQDLGLTLHRMVLALCQKAGVRLVAVGDPDQSIYGFAGSMPKLLKELAKAEWVEPVSL